MLLRLLPDQVMKQWDFFKVAMESTLPPIAGGSEDRMNNILEMFLTSGLIMWISYRKNNTETKVTGFLVTQIVVDDPSKTKSVLIYSIYTEDGFKLSEWEEGFKEVSKYAKGLNCVRVTAYSNHPAVIKRAEDFGGDSSYRFISVPI